MRHELRAQLRRCWPLLALLLVVALLATRWTGSVASREWLAALDERLADAGAGTNASMVDAERDHLTALRAFSFTTGLAEALDTLDIATVETLLGPADANLGIPMVDVLDETGRVVFAFRGESQVPPIYRDRADVGIVQRALRGEPDLYGDRFTTLLVSDEGALVASAGSVRVDDRVVGALLVMTPLADVLTSGANLSGEMLTVYSGDGGVPLATTAPVKPRTLPRGLHRLLPAEDLPVTSSFDIPGGTAREQLGALVIRHESVAWLGVASDDRSGSVGNQVSLLTLLAIVACCGLTVLVVRRAQTRGGRPATPPNDGSGDLDLPRAALRPRETDPVHVPAGVGRRRW